MNPDLKLPVPRLVRHPAGLGLPARAPAGAEGSRGPVRGREGCGEVTPLAGAGRGVAARWEPREGRPSTPRHRRISKGKRPAPPLARISRSQRSRCPKSRDRTPVKSAARAVPLPLFGLRLEEPVPPPRVAEVGTRVSATSPPPIPRAPRRLVPPSPAAPAGACWRGRGHSGTRCRTPIRPWGWDAEAGSTAGRRPSPPQPGPEVQEPAPGTPQPAPRRGTATRTPSHRVGRGPTPYNWGRPSGRASASGRCGPPPAWPPQPHPRDSPPLAGSIRAQHVERYIPGRFVFLRGGGD
ncbi:translation initiation factor IF-2-like [Sorex araneus]|uniref:translation initiation factor IF-2-like n=1 Tax=Sorex araneus TaxID=42254 RepID=UPI0024337AF1|nr:translation initiation factor IF-2-like [Sorex araneus]